MKRLLLVLLFLSGALFAQVQPQIQGAGPPTNPCYNGGQQYVDQTNHVLYGCPSSGSNWANLGLGNLTNAGGNIRSLASDPATCSTSDTNGTNNIYYNTVSATFKFCSATNTWSAFAGGSTAWSSVTSGANANTLTETTAGSLVPAATSTAVATGQISSITDWQPTAPAALYPTPQPTLAVSQSGGSLATGTMFVAITYVGLSTTVPSAEVRTIAAGGGNSTLTPCTGSACQVTVTMPTTCTAGNLPTGVTGCTVWDSITGTGAEKQQAASNACVNITTATCVINVAGAGASLTWPTTTGINPPATQTVTMPDHVIPTFFIQKGDGNYYGTGGVDISGLNVLPQPAGTFTYGDRWFFNDTGNPPPISNALVSIHHNSGVTTGTCSTSTCATGGIDDRGLAIHDNDAATNPFYEQFLGEYIEQYFSQATFACNPLSSEDCVAGLRGTAADFRPANSGNLSVGTEIAGVSGFAARSTSGTSAYSSCGSGSNVCLAGVKGFASNQNSGNLNGAIFAGVFSGYANAGGTSGTGADFFANGSTSQFDQRNVAYTLNAGHYAAATGVFAFDSGTATAQERHEASKFFLGGTLTADNTTLAVTGSPVVTGAISTVQLGTPAAPTVTPVNPGAQTCAYRVVAQDANGGKGPAGAQTSVSNCNANITATNNVQVIFPANTVLGAGTYAVYRTVEAGNCNGVACTNGLLGTINTGSNFGTTPGNTVGNLTFLDTGQVGDGNASPSTTLNQTGSVSPFLYATNTNCSGVGTAASPSVVTCTSAAAGAFSCATNATGATCVVNTTAVTANSEIFIQATAAEGTRLGVTCNTTADTPTAPRVASKSAGVSFTINLGTVSTNPMCFDYHIVN